MNVEDAAYHTVRDAPGGVDATATRMGKNARVLRSEVDPKVGTHKFGLADADRLMGLTGDLRILHAMAANHGRVVLPSEESAEALDLLSLVLAKQQAAGDFSQTLQRALADGQISHNELKAIEACAVSTIAAMNHLVRAVRALHESQKPS